MQNTGNIAESLRRIASLRGDAAGVIEAKTGKILSFTQLEQRSNQYAWYLKESGITADDRVMLMVKPSADFICITFALFKLGAPIILIDPGMGYRNLLRCVSGVQPTAFIGIPKAHLFLRMFNSHFTSLRLRLCCGNSLGLFGEDIRRMPNKDEAFPLWVPKEDDLAAIIFTTGSTGPPKGVRYEHAIFAAQLQHIKSHYAIGPGDVDQPAFPLFALFSTALGACAVIPDMDPTKPARVNAEKFVASINRYHVTYSFGSPALWNVVGDYCLVRRVSLPTLQKVLMAGAPVSGELLERVRQILPASAEIHIPYGATESLPIVSIEAREVLRETWPQTRQGMGTCVGRALPGISIMIIAIHDGEVPQITQDMILPQGEIGEIVVSGNVVTRAYDNNDSETRLSKTTYQERLWHRLGDTGFLDDHGRLWFCGRKAHRVQTRHGTKFSVKCEAIVNNHPEIFRSALVGIGADGHKEAVLVLERKKKRNIPDGKLLEEVRSLAQQSPLTADIDHFLFHKEFPVDIRHNAKIFREKLVPWAEARLTK